LPVYYAYCTLQQLRGILPFCFTNPLCIIALQWVVARFYSLPGLPIAAFCSSRFLEESRNLPDVLYQCGLRKVPVHQRSYFVITVGNTE